MNHRDDQEIGDQLKTYLDLIRTEPVRDPQAAQQGRAAFLSEVDALRLPENSKTTVSQPVKGRLNGWKFLIAQFQSGKERRRMVTTLISILVAAALLFGGTGATVYAAQDSQPGEPLYSLKTWSEDARLDLARTDQEKIQLTLSFAERRLGEIQALGEANQPVPSQVSARYEQQIATALQLAGNMDDPAMLMVLAQVQERLQNQEQIMQQWAASGVGQGDPQFIQQRERLQERLQEQLQLVQQGLADPQQFRERMRTRTQQETQDGTPQANPTQASQPGAGGNGNGPGGGYGPGPLNPSETPMNGGGYGPGAGPGPVESTPQTGDGYGPGPLNPSETPMNGGGYGPGEPVVTAQPGGEGGAGPGEPMMTSEPGNGGQGTGSGGEPMTTVESGSGDHGGGSGAGGGRP